jgi:phosphoribosylanthranilate isomerase
MTRIKICGVKRPETLELLGQLQVDYAGFIFAESRRQITAQAAGELLRSVDNPPPAVGVFVNPTLSELEEVLTHAPLSVIQLHGQERPAFCREVASRFQLPVWKAVAVADQSELADLLRSYQGAVEAFLFDTHDPRLAGGTGRRFSWELIPQLRQQANGTPCIVAGGINEENVEELLKSYQPHMIDISSGVETNGEKDHKKIIRFMQRVRGNDRRHDRK